MAGLQTPDYVDGFSLVPQLADQSVSLSAPAISSWGRGNYSVRTENWRLIKYFDGEMELYHNKQDKHEWHNLAKKAEYQDKLKELVAMLPKTEAPIIEEYISDWSLFGADAKRLKKAKPTSSKQSKKARKKAKKKANSQS